MRRLVIKIKDFLKAISCCRSSCMNQTIENISIEHFEAMTDRLEALTEIIQVLRGIHVEPAIPTELPEPEEPRQSITHI